MDIYIHADVNMNLGGAAKVKCKRKSTELRHHQLLSCLFSRTLYEYSYLMFMYYYTVWVCVYMCACVRACVRVCVCVCARTSLSLSLSLSLSFSLSLLHIISSTTVKRE